MTLRARGVFLLCLASLAVGLTTGRATFTNLAYLLAGLLIVAFLWSRTSLRGVEVTRRPGATRSQVGHAFEEALVIANRSRFPKLWVELRDTSELPEHRVSTVIVGLGAGRERSLLVRTYCTRRGRFRLGPAQLRAGDPFGLFPSVRSVPQTHQLVVLPMVAPLPSFPLPAGRLQGGVAVTEPTHQITPNAAGVRDYQPGDGFNRIHWKSTARQRRLIVKEFELDPMGDVWIVLDACRDVQAELPPAPVVLRESPLLPSRITLPASTLEYGVAACASLAYHFLGLDRSVGLLAYDRTRHGIQPDRGSPQLFRLLETLAVLDGEGLTAVEDVLRIEAVHLTRGAMVLAVTPSASHEVLASLYHLRKHALTPALVLLDARSFQASQDNQAIALEAQRSGIPTRVVRLGDSIAAALSTASPSPAARAA